MPDTSSRISASSSTIRMSDAIAYSLFPANLAVGRRRLVGRARRLARVGNLSDLAGLGGAGQRNRHPHRRAAHGAVLAMGIVELEQPIMLLGNAVDDGQAEP